jgi:hypothetical protein
MPWRLAEPSIVNSSWSPVTTHTTTYVDIYRKILAAVVTGTCLAPAKQKRRTGGECSRLGLTKLPPTGFRESIKIGRFTGEQVGLPFSRICRHGFGVRTEPIHIPGRTGSNGNRPNRTGSHRFCEPCSRRYPSLDHPNAHRKLWRIPPLEKSGGRIERAKTIVGHAGGRRDI